MHDHDRPYFNLGNLKIFFNIAVFGILELKLLLSSCIKRREMF